MMKKLAIFFVVMFLAAGAAHGVSDAAAEDNSVVIGRITGSQQPLPGWFYKSTSLNNQGIYNIEFTGFRFVHKETGKSYKIRALGRGYYHKELPPGKYDLIRHRTDRISYRNKKTLVILTLVIPARTVVNLGQLDIVIDGDVDQYLVPHERGWEGTFTYHFHYERTTSDSENMRPLTWLKREKQKIADRYGDSIQNTFTVPTREKDSSKKVLFERSDGRH